MSFDNLFSHYIYLSRYSRYLPKEKRREMWPETVGRYFDFFTVHLKEQHGYVLTPELRNELETAVLNLETVPSMRCLMTAGPALERENIAGYNCAYLAINTPKAFSEMLYILMNGTGVGFSVERQYINQLPEIPEDLYQSDTVIHVPDSKIGWAKALNELISLLYTGLIPKWDVSKLRPAGAILKTFGGRSSGSEPLERLFKFVINEFQESRGHKLTSIQVHDICCMIGECIVSGGVRRSATISLSNLSDDRMRTAKTGQWWNFTPWRSIANNSAVYTDKRPSMDVFFNEWKSLYDSKSGERGIFSRYAARNVINHNNEFRKEFFGQTDVRFRDLEHEWGCNPCSEVLMRPDEFCNLTEMIIRAMDTLEDLKKKARVAAILGTFQSTLTNFRFLSKKWKFNTEDERLLGVSMTGIMDHKLLSGQMGEEKLAAILMELKTIVIKTNIEFAQKIGIQPSVATTAVKPSGTVSALAGTASGIHPRHAKYYLRAVRADKKDPLAQMMIEQGFPHESDQMRPDFNDVFYFPIKSPKHALLRSELAAVDHLNLWLVYQKHWAEHKPSITVSVREDEWLKVGAWVYDNFEWVSGISFLPFSDHTYAQAPFQELTEESYKDWAGKVPTNVDWTALDDYEKEDNTKGSQELACVSSGGCEI